MKPKSNKCAITLLIVLIIVISFTFLFFGLHLNKKNIHNATREEIRAALYSENYDGLVDEIVIYLSNNKNCNIDNLKVINGIGDEKVKELKLVFRDNISFKHFYEYE